MKKKFMFLIALLCIASAVYAASYTKPRIIVTTDITNEPDDQQSIIRLLAYSNNFDIEGLIGSTSIWLLSNPATHVIHDCIESYGKVRENLVLHDKDFPTEDYLHSVTKTGNRAYGMSAINERGSDGSRLIIDAVDKPDPRPVWLLVWGGANTVAQAIWTVRETRTPQEFETFLNKIRVYDLACQDDAGAWMGHNFPDLFHIRNVLIYKGMSPRASGDEWHFTEGGNESIISSDWVRENIQENHGAMGTYYPDVKHLYEGDSPTFLYLMPNGLNDPKQQWQGSWGGRFSREKEKNVNLTCEISTYAGAFNTKGKWINEKPYTDYWVFADAEDTWEYDGTVYENNRYCTLFRWREDFQNDFAARMDWCIKDYENANHNPIAVVDDDETKTVLYKDVVPGSSFKIDAIDSSDPDGDKLNFNWWVYHEAGTYKKEVTIKNATSPKPVIKVPKDAHDKTIHVILTLRDTGTPPLTSYRRVVLKGVSE